MESKTHKKLNKSNSFSIFVLIPGFILGLGLGLTEKIIEKNEKEKKVYHAYLNYDYNKEISYTPEINKSAISENVKTIRGSNYIHNGSIAVRNLKTGKYDYYQNCSLTIPYVLSKDTNKYVNKTEELVLSDKVKSEQYPYFFRTPYAKINSCENKNVTDIFSKNIPWNMNEKMIEKFNNVQEYYYSDYIVFLNEEQFKVLKEKYVH